METDCDVVVLGLGPGGEHVATELARAGLRVVAIDQRLVGGECPYFGCIPTKMMVRAAGTLAEADRVERLAGSADVHPAWAPVAERISREATDGWDDAVAVQRLRDAGATFVRGTGVLTGSGRVRVAEDEYVAARGVVLNTGTEPAVPPIDGLAQTPFWTNRDAVRLTELPASMVVLGGGAIGVELAQVFARFGVEVTVLETAGRILAAEEPEASELVAAALTADGVTVRTGVDIASVTHDPQGFCLDLQDARVRADRLLVTAGRHHNLDRIGLETVGLDPTARVLATDERMRAGPGIWAVGDITGKGAFTHVSMYQAAVAVRDLLGEDGPWADYRAVSRVTFTDPEVGSVGLTEQQAHDSGMAVSASSTDLGGRGWLAGAKGLIKLVADTERGLLVGATTVGPSGGEVLSMLATAVHAEVPVDTLLGMHFAFPTYHRAVLTALQALG